jgi:hypothetical protein
MVRSHHYDEFDIDDDDQLAEYLSLLDKCSSQQNMSIYRDDLIQWVDKVSGSTVFRRAVIWWEEMNGDGTRHQGTPED